MPNLEANALQCGSRNMALVTSLAESNRLNHCLGAIVYDYNSKHQRNHHDQRIVSYHFNLAHFISP